MDPCSVITASKSGCSGCQDNATYQKTECLIFTLRSCTVVLNFSVQQFDGGGDNGQFHMNAYS